MDKKSAGQYPLPQVVQQRQRSPYVSFFRSCPVKYAASLLHLGVLNLGYHRLEDRHVSPPRSQHRQVIAFCILCLELGSDLLVPRRLGACFTVANSRALLVVLRSSGGKNDRCKKVSMHKPPARPDQFSDQILRLLAPSSFHETFPAWTQFRSSTTDVWCVDTIEVPWAYLHAATAFLGWQCAAPTRHFRCVTVGPRSMCRRVESVGRAKPPTRSGKAEKMAYQADVHMASSKVLGFLKSRLVSPHIVGEPPLEASEERGEYRQVTPSDRRHEGSAKLVLLHQAWLRQHGVHLLSLVLRLELPADLHNAVVLDRGQELVGLQGLHLADGPAEHRAGGVSLRRRFEEEEEGKEEFVRDLKHYHPAGPVFWRHCRNKYVSAFPWARLFERVDSELGDGTGCPAREQASRNPAK